MAPIGKCPFWQCDLHSIGRVFLSCAPQVAQRPDIQAALQAEADALFDKTGGGSTGSGLTYTGLGEALPLLGRCVLETLRLWPAVS